MSDVNLFQGVPCTNCGETALRLEYRELFEAKPLGTWSLAGVQDKRSVVARPWPYCVCDACGAESRGTLAERGEM